jgi:hypothetical protein
VPQFIDEVVTKMTALVMTTFIIIFKLLVFMIERKWMRTSCRCTNIAKINTVEVLAKALSIGKVHRLHYVYYFKQMGVDMRYDSSGWTTVCG